MIRLALVCLVGGVGAMARFGVEELVVRRLPHQRPWATAGVNVVAAFLVGLAASNVALTVANGLVPFPSHYVASTYLTVGFCGGFSTFSSAVAVPVLEWRHSPLRNLAVLVVTPLLCALAFWIGLSL